MNTEKTNDLHEASCSSLSTPAQEEPFFIGQKSFHNLQLLILVITMHLMSGQNRGGYEESKSDIFFQNFAFLIINEKTN